MDFFLEQFATRTDLREDAIEHAYKKGIKRGSLRYLSSPEVWANLVKLIEDGKYKIVPPHQALIPKDNGDFRTVYVNEPLDRVILHIVNNLLFELCSDMVHKQCKSYQKGLSCQKAVKEISEIMTKALNDDGMKADLTKYFDSVPIEKIDELFREIEKRVGKSALLDVVKDYYHTDLCFDPHNNILTHYQSLKQGCSVASFLADAMLYDIDKEISEMGVYYSRYSDDAIILGDDWKKAYDRFAEMLNEKGLTLNPKKVEILSPKKYFKFLGFAIRGKDISLSKKWIKYFQKEIEKRTIKSKKSYKACLNDVMDFLYRDKYAWALAVLTTINVEEDIDTLDQFVKDALRAKQTGKTKIGGLGFEVSKKSGVITRGTGKNVKANRLKTSDEIVGYKSLRCMRNALLTDMNLYKALSRAS